MLAVYQEKNLDKLDQLIKKPTGPATDRPVGSPIVCIGHNQLSTCCSYMPEFQDNCLYASQQHDHLSLQLESLLLHNVALLTPLQPQLNNTAY